MAAEETDQKQQVKRRQSQSYKLKKFAKISKFRILKRALHATHLLKFLDKLCKYEMDPMSIVEDTERTRFCPQTDRRTNGQGDTSIPPFQLRWSGGYNNRRHSENNIRTCPSYFTFLNIMNSPARKRSNFLQETNRYFELMLVIFYYVFLNSLAPERFGWNFMQVIFKYGLLIDGWDISCEIATEWMSLEFNDDKSTLIQEPAWCHQATSHYLSQH